MAAQAAPVAPSLATDLDCYQQSRAVAVAGAGFTPGSPFTLTREGAPQGAGTVAQDGTLASTFSSGRLPSGVGERAFTLTAQAGTQTATARVRVTRFSAAFTPTRATPATHVRFSVFGFGRRAPVYVHYLRSGATGSSDTVSLGTASGPCGRIASSAARRLFPFTPRTGTWSLQFDTKRSYSAKAVPRFVLPVTVRAR